MDSSIIADRFVPWRNDRWLDLATGELAWLRMAPAESGEAQSAWADRCARLAGSWHPRCAGLLDYGVVGAGARFEAYEVEGPDAAHGRCGCGRGRVPAASRTTNGERDGADPRVAAVRYVPRAALQSITELLEQEPSPGFTRTEIEAPPGSGGRTFLRFVAREARRLGWLSLHADALECLDDTSGEALQGRPPAAWRDALAGRHVALLLDARGDPGSARAAARFVLETARTSMLAHRWFVLVEHSDAHAPVCLDPIEPTALVDMLVPRCTNGARLRRWQRLANESRGRPGVFLEAVTRCRPTHAGRAPASGVVHEAEAALAASGSPRHRMSVHLRFPPWSASRARARPAARTADPHQLVARGRHAAAARLLARREAEQVRRACWIEAGDLALLEGRLREARAQLPEALRAFERAAAYFARARDETRGIAAAVHAGAARLWLADPRLAESCLRSAIAVAEALGIRDGAEWGRAELCRVLCWSARVDEAHALRPLAGNSDREPHGAVQGTGAWPAPLEIDVLSRCVAVRTAAATGDLAGASRLYEEAVALASAAADPAGLACAELARLDCCGVIGDLAGAREAFDRVVRHAREGRRAVDVLAARVALLDVFTRRGRATDWAGLARQVRRGLKRLPPLLAAQAEVALARVDGRDESAAAAPWVGRGLAALKPRLGPPCHVTDLRGLPMFDDVIEVLRICQEQEDPRRALAEVAGVVRERTRAASATWLVAAQPPIAITPEGGRARLRCAERALDTGLAVDPQPSEGGVEAAVPVRSIGAVSGALAVRWSGEMPLDPRRVVSLLTATAAAAAPCVRALADSVPSAAAEALEHELLGTSAAMRQVRLAVARAADAPFPALVHGESGSGKELVARAIHRAGPRRARPLCAINCAAVPDELLESELFGHVRGAFTGAVAERRGLFEEADGGVLFLDEIGELSPRGQAKLLRAIQEGEIRRVGETFPRRVDVRIVAATNRDLAEAVEAGTFRRDLWYRLDVLRIVVPPLRERPEDVPPLAMAFWRRACERVGSRAVLGASALAALARYDWPGNVRELQNVLAAMAVAAPRHGTVGSALLPDVVARVAGASVTGTLEDARRVFETRFVRAALARAGGNRGRAAAELGLTRQGLAKLMERLGLTVLPGAADAGVDARCG